MFNPHAKISSRAEHDRLLRVHAVEEAGALFRRHGGEALALLSPSRLNQAATAEERRYDRLVIVELERLERLGRLQRRGAAPASLSARTPPIRRAAILAVLGRLIGRGP